MPIISITQDEYDVIMEGFEAVTSVCESCDGDDGDAYVNHVNATQKYRTSFRKKYLKAKQKEEDRKLVKRMVNQAKKEQGLI